MSSMYVNTDQKNWDEILPFITHAYNTTIQETTGYSPFFLLFGREPMSLLDDENIPTDSNLDDYDEYIENYLDKIARTRQVVINNTEKTQKIMKRNYDKKHNERIYEPGHLVAVWTPVRKIGKCEKLLRKYFGPYRILKKLSNVNYLIEPKDNPGQDPLIVHVSRLKPYFERIDEVTHEDMTTSGRGKCCIMINIYKDLISTLQLVERLDRYPLRNLKKIDSLEPEVTSMNVKKEEIDPQMSKEDKISHLMKRIAEKLYQVLLPRNVQSTVKFITECRRVEALRCRRVTPTRYERLPNVAPLCDQDDGEDQSSMIRKSENE
ncbi:K02A2.6-like [Cordylochernes scorpioides]|uniref:K02A2.6-like n=1 Tax=Cordylochernes scorpioides TaxID=51811 RepID=A0ABY6KGW0_9ARAC|nr:K02A2.6-like [Cordylochernes scorpioides]